MANTVRNIASSQPTLQADPNSKINLSQNMTSKTGNSPTSGNKTLQASVQYTKINGDSSNPNIGHDGPYPYIPGPDDRGGYIAISPPPGYPVDTTDLTIQIQAGDITLHGGILDPNSRPVQLHSAQIACFTFLNYFDACQGWPVGDLGGYIINCCGSGGCSITNGSVSPNAAIVPGDGTNSCYSKLVSSAGEVCVAKRSGVCLTSGVNSPRSIEKTPVTTQEDSSSNAESNPNDGLDLIKGSPSSFSQDIPPHSGLNQVTIRDSNGNTVAIIDRQGGEVTRLTSGVSALGQRVFTPINPATGQPVGASVLSGIVSKSPTSSPGNSPQPELQDNPSSDGGGPFEITVTDYGTGTDTTLLSPPPITKYQPYDPPSGESGELQDEPRDPIKCPPCDCDSPEEIFRRDILRVLSIKSVQNAITLKNIVNTNKRTAPKSSSSGGSSSGNPGTGSNENSQLVIVQDDASQSFVTVSGS